jgi:hypothetical protein
VTDLLHFVVLALALLAAPGPTNALLATAGATQVLRRALPLLAAAGSCSGSRCRVRAGEDVRLSTLRCTGAVIVALFALFLPASALWSAG